MSRRHRTQDIDIDFTGPRETAVGWAIPVSKAFRLRLDILWTRWKDGKSEWWEGWTQGVPACFAFEQGDIVYDPPPPPPELRIPWAETMAGMRRFVQVESAVPDREVDEGVEPGEVTFRLHEAPDFSLSASRRYRTTQHGFVEFLRTGVWPEELTGPVRLAPVAGSLVRMLDGRPQLDIEYADAQGVVTERRVTIRSVVHARGRVYVNAHCHSAKAPRAFRLDRVLAAHVPGSSEVARGADVRLLIEQLVGDLVGA